MKLTPTLSYAAAVSVWVVSSWAWAEADSFYLGTGIDGRFDSGYSANDGHPQPFYLNDLNTRLAANASAGARAVTVENTAGFDDKPNRLVMIHQSTGYAAAVSGTASSVNLDSSAEKAGRWELARISAVDKDNNQLLLTRPLLQAFPSALSQVVLVREFTDVNIGEHTYILAVPWDGRTGGVTAFLATGNIYLQPATGGRFPGGIGAVSQGFRTINNLAQSGGEGCASILTTTPLTGKKGEGLSPSLFGQGGFGNALNGGGGGNCSYAGGGGGSHAGAGGQGGLSFDDGRDVGGRGGAALGYSVLGRMLFGGAGGIGHHGTDSTAKFSGDGGGIIFIRARSLRGAGVVDTSGEPGQPIPRTVPSFGGAAGGGAGGTVVARFVEDVSCLEVSAEGGPGGESGFTSGPGGGGGGGKVLLQGASLSGCTHVNATGGAAGTLQSPLGGGTDVTKGAVAGGNGSVEVRAKAFALPAKPVFKKPTGNTVTSVKTQTFQGTAPAGLQAVLYLESETLNLRVPLGTSGSWSHTRELSPGAYTVQAATEDAAEGVASERTPPIVLTITATGPGASILRGPEAESGPSVVFEFASEQPGVTLECKLDGAEFAPCASPQAYERLAVGPHSFQVRARDSAGKAGEATQPYTWVVRGPEGGGPQAPQPTSPEPLSESQLTGSGCSASGDAKVILYGLALLLAARLIRPKSR